MDHHPEGGPHQPAIHLGLGKPADPEIDTVDPPHGKAAIGIGDQPDIRVQRAEGIRRRPIRQNQIGIGRAELVQHRRRQPVPRPEILPACIGLQQDRIDEAQRLADIGVGRGKKRRLDLVQRADAHIPAPRHVEGEEVGADADKVIADAIDHHRVDLLRRLPGDARQHRPRAKLGIARLRHIAILRQRREALRKGPFGIGRVQEGIEQRHLRHRPIRVRHRNRLRHHRMAKAIDGRGEFLADRGIGFRVPLGKAVIPLAPDTHATQQRLGEFGEDDALIFRLVHDLGRLEQLLCRQRRPAGLIAGRKLIDMEVVVAGKDRVHRGQRDVLVHAPVARHHVVQQVDEGVGIQKQGLPLAHEVRHQPRQDRRIDGPVGIQQVGIELHQGLRPARQMGSAEHRPRLDVVHQHIAQRG